METENKHSGEKIPWHTAFFEAIQLELDEYSQDLEFLSEYPLNTEPLKIDVVIIKKNRDIIIKKNIASIFRKENIVEYKSPDDYVSVDDFYKVYGYACLYQSLNKVNIKNLTLTFVESRYPRELLGHLKKERNYVVEEKWPGIYYVKGDILPIQIIDSRKLSVEENIWLKDLNNKLDTPELKRITTEIQRKGKDARIKAYLYVIAAANKEFLLEVGKMTDYGLALYELFEENGLIAKWKDVVEAKVIAEGEARAEEKKATEIAGNLFKNGFSTEQIVEFTGLDIEKVKALKEG
jgi:hypothetical protein